MRSSSKPSFSSYCSVIPDAALVRFIVALLFKTKRLKRSVRVLLYGSCMYKKTTDGNWVIFA